MIAAERLSMKCGAILFVAAVIISHLSFSLASSDWSDAEEPVAQSPSSDSVRTVLPQLAAPDEESSPQRSHESSPQSTLLSAALADPPTTTSTQNVTLLPGQSDELSSFPHNPNDVSDAATPEERPSVGSFPRQARAPSSRRERFSTARRIIALCMILFFTALAGAIVSNMKPLAAMMARENAYAELCPPNSPPSNDTSSAQTFTVDTLSSGSPTTNGTLQSGRDMYLCKAQEARTEGLYTVAFAAACVANAFAGPLIDSVGPPVTSFIGHSVEIIGLLLFSLRQYASGLAMVAAGQDIAFLASLSLARMFPERRGIVLGVLGSLGSLSALVPHLLRLIVSSTRLTLQQVTWCYAGLVSLPALLAGVTLLPSRQHSEDRTESTVPQGEPAEEMMASARESGPLPPLTPITADLTEQTLQRAGNTVRSSQRTGALRRLLRRVHVFLANPVLRRSSFLISTLVVTLNFTIAGIISNYFIQAAERIFHGPAAHLLPYFSPAAALPCAAIGLVPDRFGASMASLILAGAGLIMNSTSFIRHDVGGYISLSSLVVYISALTLQVHWSCQELYSLQCRGTMSGVILALGGSLSLFASLLYSSVTLEMFSGNTTSVRVGLGVLQLLQLVLIYVACRQVEGLQGGDDRVANTLRCFLRRRCRPLEGRRHRRELSD